MTCSRFFASAIAYVTLLATTGLALSQAEIEVRKAQPAPDAPLVEIVPRAVAAAPARRAAEPAAEPEPVSANSGNTYRLRANDQLDIQVFGHLDLSGLCSVREDGTVSLRLIKEVVPVGGMTLENVERRIRALLAKDYLRDPRVSVNIAKHATIKIAVMGRVTQPKTLAVPANQPISLVQAIGAAGGRSNLGNLRKVTLKRGSKVMQFDVEDMIRTDGANNIELQDGDVINVPESRF